MSDAATTLSPADFSFISELVRRRSAIVLETGKEYLAEFRLGSLARRSGFASLAELVAQLRNNPPGELHKRVVEVMTTNETSFFRDLHPFEALRTHVLPRLAARRSAERRFNVWCAASSSGQEPYSIAILLRELGLCAPLWNIRFNATDLSREMVSRSREGLYSMLEVNRGLPAPMLVRHFRAASGGFQVSEELRKMVQFTEMNLCDAWPIAGSLDVIFLRNVLIYFDADRKKDILGRARRLLRPDGCLFLGAAETTLNLDGEFHKVQRGKATWYQPTPQPL